MAKSWSLCTFDGDVLLAEASSGVNSTLRPLDAASELCIGEAGELSMFQSLIRNSAVGLFGVVARLGLHRLPLIDRAFLALYALYKQYIEAGPINRLREFAPS